MASWSEVDAVGEGGCEGAGSEGAVSGGIDSEGGGGAADGCPLPVRQPVKQSVEATMAKTRLLTISHFAYLILASLLAQIATKSLLVLYM